MKKEDLEKKFTEEFKAIIPEGVEIDITKVNFEGLNKFVNDDTNNVVAGKKDEYMEAGRNSFLTEKGFKDVAAFDTFKSTADSSESDLKGKYTKLEGKYNTLDSDHKKLNTQIATDKEIGELTSTEEKGYRVDPKFGKFVHTEFSTARAAAKADGKELKMDEWAPGYFEKNKQYQLPISTGRKARQNVLNTKKSSDDFLKDRYAHRYKK